MSLSHEKHVMHASQQTNTTIAHLLEQVDEAAARQGLSIETWLRRQLKSEAQTQSMSEGADDEKEILDLVIRHFRALDLDIDDQKLLAGALLDTIEHGKPKDVELGRLRRRYRFRRRAMTLSIRLGQGQVNLSLPYAFRLASAFCASGKPRQSAEEAA